MKEKIVEKLIYRGIIKPNKFTGKCIIMYHGIDLHENIVYNRRYFSKNNFEKHLKFFKKNYNVISLSDFFYDKNLESNKLNIAITFDDGYRNNFLYALPLLEDYKVPATFFVTGLRGENHDLLWADLVDLCSRHIDTTKVEFEGKKFPAKGNFLDLRNFIRNEKICGTPRFLELREEMLRKANIDINEEQFLDYWQLMSSNEIVAVSNSLYVTIGSHGFFHNNLGNIDHDSAIREISESKLTLENLTQNEINSIAYPDGSYTSELVEDALRLGFKHQCAVNYNHEKEESIPHLHDRLGLYPIISTHYLNYLISKFLK